MFTVVSSSNTTLFLLTLQVSFAVIAVAFMLTAKLARPLTLAKVFDADAAVAQQRAIAKKVFLIANLFLCMEQLPVL